MIEESSKKLLLFFVYAKIIQSHIAMALYYLMC